MSTQDETIPLCVDFYDEVRRMRIMMDMTYTATPKTFYCMGSQCPYWESAEALLDEDERIAQEALGADLKSRGRCSKVNSKRLWPDAMATDKMGLPF